MILIQWLYRQRELRCGNRPHAPHARRCHAAWALRPVFHWAAVQCCAWRSSARAAVCCATVRQSTARCRLAARGYSRGTHGVLTVLAEQVPAAQPHGSAECGCFAPVAFVRHG